MVQRCLFAVYSQTSDGIQSEHCKENADSPKLQTHTKNQQEDLAWRPLALQQPAQCRNTEKCWWERDSASSASCVCVVQMSLHKIQVVGLNVEGNTSDFWSRIGGGEELVIVTPISNPSQKISSLLYDLLMEPWQVRSIWFRNPLLCGCWYKK